MRTGPAARIRAFSRDSAPPARPHVGRVTWSLRPQRTGHAHSSRAGTNLARDTISRLVDDPDDPFELVNRARQSPLRHVAAVRTPLLMLQAEADLRCPPQDNEQFFIALRNLGRTVEYVLYENEAHVYGNAGRPDRRIDRQTRMLAWFDRYLRA